MTVPAPSLPVRPRELDLWIEGLRGVAALLVGLEHLWLMNRFFPPEEIPFYVRMWAAGHASVLVFFILSGYVIGLTNQGVYSGERARAYLGRRAVRLLPIFWLALLLTLAVNYGDSLWTYGATALMLQNENFTFPWHLHPPRANGPMWSLNYEAVYYLFFLYLWRRPQSFSLTLIFALGLGVAGWLLPATLFPRFLAGYAVGWIFWGVGWWLSRQPLAASGPLRAPLLAGLLALMATHHLASGQIFLFGLGLRQHDVSMVNLSNLSLLPGCLWLVGTAARRDFPFRRALAVLTFLVPAATTVLLMVTRHLSDTPDWMAGAALTAAALLTLGLTTNGWLRKFSPFGRISYAFYLVHMPLLLAFKSWSFPVPSALTFAGTALLWFATSTILAIFLELWLQPRLRRLLTSSRSPA